MKKSLIQLLVILFIIITANSCKKNDLRTDPDVALPDLTTQVVASVSGFITDEDGRPLPGAEVKGGIKTVSTNSFGFFKIENAGVSSAAAFVKATKAGYFTGARTFVTKPDEETFVRIKLVPKTNSAIVSASTGGEVNSSDGSSITLPADAVVLTSNSTAYTGTIHVASYWINPSDQKEMQLTMPGDLRAIDETGSMKTLSTFGMLAVELSGDAGEPLQIAAGKKATLKYPIPSSLLASAPATIPLWYFDESNGLWKQEGTAVKNGNIYSGEVSHFSWWNCDVPYSIVNFTARFQDAASQPLVNVPVSIYIDGQPNSAKVSYSNSDGSVRGFVPANSSLVLNVLSNCNAVSYSRNFTTTATDFDLGTVNADLTQYTITLTGSVNDCNNAPVTNGFVMIAGPENVYHAAAITNGGYNFTFLDCLNANYTVTAVDFNTNTESVVSSFVLSAGVNNMAPIFLCGSPTQEYLVYSVDGTFYVNTDFPNIEAKAWINADSTLPGGFYTSIWVFDTSGQQQLSLEIPRAPVTGLQTARPGYGPLIWSPAVFGWLKPLNEPYEINVTEFGPPGGYLTVNMAFTGITALNGPMTYPMTCNFRVKRVN